MMILLYRGRFIVMLPFKSYFEAYSYYESYSMYITKDFQIDASLSMISKRKCMNATDYSIYPDNITVVCAIGIMFQHLFKDSFRKVNTVSANVFYESMCWTVSNETIILFYSGYSTFFTSVLKVIYVRKFFVYAKAKRIEK